MFTVLEHYHKIIQNENLKAAPDKSHFFLTRVKFLGHNIERNSITPIKSRIDAIQKFQPPTNKKKIQEFFEMLNFLSKYVYKMQLYLRPSIISSDNKITLNGPLNIKNDLKKLKKTFNRTNFKHNSRSKSTIICNVRCFKIWHRRSITTILQ